MSRIHPEHHDPEANRPSAVLLRREPDEDQDEEDDNNKKDEQEEGDDEDDDEGYSVERGSRAHTQMIDGGCKTRHILRS